MAIETVAFPLPSELVMPLAGWMLVEERGLGWPWLFLVAACGATGSLIGSVGIYYAGALGGRPFLWRFGRYIFISHQDLERGDRWFQRYGSWAVLLARMIPVARSIISVPAGIARMPLLPFVTLTFVGSFFWSLGLAWAGFVLGDNWERIRDWMRPVEVPVLIALALLVIWYVYRHIREFLHSSAVPSETHGDG